MDYAQRFENWQYEVDDDLCHGDMEGIRDLTYELINQLREKSNEVLELKAAADRQQERIKELNNLVSSHADQIVESEQRANGMESRAMKAERLLDEERADQRREGEKRKHRLKQTLDWAEEVGIRPAHGRHNPNAGMNVIMKMKDRIEFLAALVRNYEKLPPNRKKIPTKNLLLKEIPPKRDISDI